MSASLFPYLVGLGDLRQAIGGQDGDLLSTLEGKFAKEITYANAQCKGDGDRLPNASAALAALINGRKVNPEAVNRSAFALEILCKHFGSALKNDLYLEFHSPWLSAVGWLDRFLRSKPSPKILAGYEDLLTSMTPKKACAEFGRLKSLDPFHPEPIVIRGRMQYLSWLEAACTEHK